MVVVVVAPVVDDATHVAQAVEPVLRQVLVAEAAVEALDVGVLHRFAGLDEAQLHAVASGPVLHRAARELRAVVGADDLGQAALGLDLVEQPRELRNFIPMMRTWQQDIVHFRCSLPPDRQAWLRHRDPEWRCEDVRFDVALIDFSSLGAEEERALSSIPSRLRLSTEQVNMAIAAGRLAVAQSAQVRAFSAELQKTPKP